MLNHYLILLLWSGVHAQLLSHHVAMIRGSCSTIVIMLVGQVDVVCALNLSTSFLGERLTYTP